MSVIITYYRHLPQPHVTTVVTPVTIVEITAMVTDVQFYNKYSGTLGVSPPGGPETIEKSGRTSLFASVLVRRVPGHTSIFNF